MAVLKHIHCNKCFRIDPVNDTVYWLTSCGHILCQSCLNHSHAARKREEHQRKTDPDYAQAQGQDNNNGSEDFCVLCKKACELIQLAENVDNLPENIQPFFRPVESLCNEAASTWKFQEQNLTKLIDHLQSKTKRQYEVLMKARTELLNMKAMKVENQALKAENMQIRQQIQELQRHQQVGGNGHNGKGGGGHAPFTPVTPQIRAMNPPADRVQPPTTPHVHQRTSREEPASTARVHKPPTDARAGGGETGKDPKRARSTTSNVGTNVSTSRANATPRLPTNPGRISLVSHQPSLMSPRLTLSHQPNDVLQSPRRPPSVHALHHIAQPRYPTTSMVVHQSQGGVTVQQGLGPGNLIAISNRQGRYGYLQTPVQALQGGHIYPTVQQGWSRVDPALPGLPQQGVVYPGHVFAATAAAPSVGLSYRVMPGEVAGNVSGGAVAQDPLIRMRNSASAARTTWQQQQQQQQRQLQPQTNQQQTHQQYGYSAVPRPVFPRPHHG